ncbi:hypothetical protein [uncultured Kordia sp.]|uniref:hypothetical protein n=1 Tax=uncultured Kordia sp. TaxID=507699 RepID=UPI00260D56CB|nr:hypothetical protein [uncultured Kordia sp.]
MLSKITRLDIFQLSLLILTITAITQIFIFSEKNIYNEQSSRAIQFLGAMIGFGLTAAASIIGIIWIEVFRIKNRKA